MEKITRQLEHKDYKPLNHGKSIYILADGLELKNNQAALFRLADAFDVKALFFLDSIKLEADKKFVRISRSTTSNIPYHELKKFADLKSYIPDSTVTFALEWTNSSQSLHDYCDEVRGSNTICLIIGSESKGVSQKILEGVNHCYHIPMYGKNSSMNVIQATAIALYEIVRK